MTGGVGGERCPVIKSETMSMLSIMQRMPELKIKGAVSLIQHLTYERQNKEVSR